MGSVTSTKFAALGESALFTPLKLGDLSLKHRIVQVSTGFYLYFYSWHHLTNKSRLP